MVLVVVDAGRDEVVVPLFPPPPFPPPPPEPSSHSLGLATQSPPWSNALLMLSPRTKTPPTSSTVMIATINA